MNEMQACLMATAETYRVAGMMTDEGEQQLRDAMEAVA